MPVVLLSRKKYALEPVSKNPAYCWPLKLVARLPNLSGVNTAAEPRLLSLLVPIPRIREPPMLGPLLDAAGRLMTTPLLLLGSDATGFCTCCVRASVVTEHDVPAQL